MAEPDSPFLSRSAASVALRNTRGEVLLLRRANTGFMDGYYDLPSGHVERDEPVRSGAVRELREETGIVVKESDLRLWHVSQNSSNGRDYYYFFFEVTNWQGEPTITEPDKCDDMRFFPLDKLPKLTVGSHVALPHIDESEVSFGYIDQAFFDRLVAED